MLQDVIEFRFIGSSLEKGVTNLAEVNNCYCAHCKSKQEFHNVEYCPIINNNFK